MRLSCAFLHKSKSTLLCLELNKSLTLPLLFYDTIGSQFVFRLLKASQATEVLDCANTPKVLKPARERKIFSDVKLKRSRTFRYRWKYTRLDNTKQSGEIKSYFASNPNLIISRKTVALQSAITRCNRCEYVIGLFCLRESRNSLQNTAN